MNLEDYVDNAVRCIRCSACKWVPYAKMQSQAFSIGCPSIDYGNFHSYSGGGKCVTALGIAEGRIGEITDETLKTVYACTMCGACDTACKALMGDMVEPLEVMRALRRHLVEQGDVDPAHMMMIEGLKQEDNVFGLPKAERSSWSAGRHVKDAMGGPVEVLLHVGCRLSYDDEQWPIIRGVAALLRSAGIDFGIAGNDEECCGGRACNCGFEGELDNYADSMKARVKRSGAHTVLTACADCYGSFKSLYPRADRALDGVEVLHVAQLLDRLMAEGRIAFTRAVPMRVTYHDPCNLGRTGETCKPWKGRKRTVLNKMVIKEPAKELSFGVMGVYQEPRNILRAIPELELVEMERIRDYTYCSGGGGGAMEAHEDFALFAARQRLKEAKATGAEALVTACPWSLRNFRDALAADGDGEFAVYDLTELAMRALGLHD